MSVDRPTPAGLRRLGEDQRLPGDFLVAFTESLLDRREQLTRQGQPPLAAREQAVGEAVQAFAADADQRGWTVDDRRIASLAGDALGLEEEYRDRHGYEHGLARLYAVCEVLEGERARQEVPLPWLRSEADPPQRPDPARQQRHPSERTRPDGRTDRARTREADRER